MSDKKSYLSRFSRNIGILTADEQNHLKASKVGVAGLGGLGGQTFANLVRMGIGQFQIADIDDFDFPNTNRQIGAAESSMGLSKVDVMAKMGCDINPELIIKKFSDGISLQSVEDFVKDSDIIVDSLDFFCLSARRLLHKTCEKYGKTVILSAPLGFSATLHAFSKTSMSSNDYFSFNDQMDSYEQMIHFAVGIAPSALHLKYLKFDKHKLVSSGTGPSISNACTLGASLLANEIMIALLERRPLFQAPYYTQFDLYLGKHQRKKLVWGNKGPLQRLKIFLANREYKDVRLELMKITK